MTDEFTRTKRSDVASKLRDNSNDNRVRLGSSPEVADYLGVAVATLAKWRWEGFGPPYRRNGGRTIRYEWAEVERWLEDSRAGDAR
jgi:predicted DNA-binding transcriptional regulator AlpA